MAEDTRRAGAAFAFAGAEDGGGRFGPTGNAEAVIGDDVLSVGPVVVAFLDADALRAADYRIELDCWPGGRLTLTQLGRRFDTFTRELHRARNQARVKGLLAHGVTMPETFAGALLVESGTVRPAELQVYDTHVTIVPADADPFQLPLGALTQVSAGEEPPSVVLARGEARTVVGQLARHRDALLRAVTERQAAQARLLAEVTGQSCFADGLAVSRGQVASFDELVRRFAAPDRAECAAKLLAMPKGGEPRLGFVRLLDPDAQGLVGEVALPESWACFLLVPVGALVVLEILAGPSAATYAFEGEITSIGADLQQLHFRRGPLALTEAEAQITPANPYRLALRRLEPLKRLRAATRARLIHNDGWAAALGRALG
jgi:hypothetical protein